ncbi:acyl-CoA dehydrogenase family protein [Streptomyces sp. ME19-01-6]|uniref:acyl-CoA dehydrogenase family protein n=1 Tax=Streptomyces sp. ME19-01-6 TaxID=3028686 RepID=UPI0029A82007|nr:acyl-CoA dehydrogenase family protein [Streptomyces sp. ME19-01-6]MDX3231458.1 acyl-CoA/acyl-ACP dehydrogenase [Streptomyces sp. ME19-01-6]
MTALALDAEDPVLDAAHRRMRARAREVAPALREAALAIDADPARMDDHLGNPAFRLFRAMGIPERFQDERNRAEVRGLPRDFLALMICSMELARGDAGTMFAAPAPALAGVVVRTIGDERQQASFYERIADGATWAFCAITEPQAGSDATRMQTALTPADPGDRSGDWLLNGAKKYVGNGSRGGVGVVFAQTGTSPLGVRAVLLELPAPGAHGEALDMIGLRGARISEMTFREVPIARDRLLGAHLPATRRGMWGAVTAFYGARVQVSATAVGLAAAVHDYVRAERRTPSPAERRVLETASLRIAAVARLVHRTALLVEADQGRGDASALCKLEAVRLVRDVTRRLPALLGRGALLDHPLLEKWARDAAALELMEGTSDIQRLRLAQDFARSGTVPAGRDTVPAGEGG